MMSSTLIISALTINSRSRVISSLIANINRRLMSSKEQVLSGSAPQPIGPYSQAIKVGNTVYLSGQIGYDVNAKRLVLDSFEAQTEQVFRNMKAVAAASGATLNDVAKLTIFITDFKNFPVVNQVMKRHFTKPYPARSTIVVASLPLGVDIEVEGVIHLNTQSKI